MVTLSIVLFGIFLIVLAPIIERFIGHDRRAVLSASGFLLNVIGVILSILMNSNNSIAFYLGLVIVIWGLLVYIVSEIIFRVNLPKVDAIRGGNCASKLVDGKMNRYPKSGYNIIGGKYFSSYIAYIFKCTPTNDSLTEFFSVTGKNYYVLWAFFYKIKGTRVITISCENDGSGCKISSPLSIVGPAGGKDGALHVKVAEDIVPSGDKLSITVDMAAALGAASVKVSGGVSKGGLKGTMNISFPDASMNTESVDLGAYKWECSSGGDSTAGISGVGETIIGYRVDQFDIEIGSEYFVFVDYELFVRYVNDLRNDPDSDEDPRTWKLTGPLVDDEGGDDGKKIKAETAEEIQVP